MGEKTILISIDGMRPDGMTSCKHPFVGEMLRAGSFTLNGKTVFPSVTLPCHMSLFHSVEPPRHGVTTNTYVPQARPVPGLFEVLSKHDKRCAMFYGWEPLRDVSRPGSLQYSSFIDAYSAEHTDALLTDLALARIAESEPDFVFLYLVETDDKGGHDCGWMTDVYLRYVYDAIENVRRVYDACKDRYSLIVTADHGGHGQTHGSDLPEDMTVPLVCIGPRFEKGKELTGVSILDVAPTVCALQDLPVPREWTGKSLLG